MLIQSNTPNKTQSDPEFRTRKNLITFSNSIKNTPTKDLYFGQEAVSNKEPKKYTLVNNTLNLFALTAYTVMIGSALVLSSKKLPEIKNSEKAVKNLKSAVANYNGVKNALQGKEQTKSLKLANYFADLKDNSRELTNNMVYGFGTLVVMPLVILFSPIGKKDATKEDRMFTVFRQPISFATLFTAQLTVEKLVKGLTNELSRYKMLKDKNGNVIDVDKDNAKKMFKENFEKHFIEKHNLKKDANGNLTEETKKSLAEIYNDIKARCENCLNETIKIQEQKFDSSIAEKKGNDEFSSIKAYHTAKDDLGKLRDLENQEKTVVDFIADKVAKAEEFSDMININKMFTESNLDKKLIKEAEKCFYVNRKEAAITNVTGVLLNSVVSQSIGLIALTYIYGKFMKGITNYKQSMGAQAVKEYKQKTDAEKGGVQ